MGNTVGGRKARQVAKVMKITGETLKFKPLVEAGDVLEDYPGLVLLESESVKHYGLRAKPMGARELLEPGRLYFLVELPEEPGFAAPRRVRSWANMSAKDRLETLMLARRSASDLSAVTNKPVMPGKGSGAQPEGKEAAGSGVRVRVRLPKAEAERLMRESRDEAEAAEKILRLCINGNKNGGGDQNSDGYKEGGADDNDSTRKVEGEELSDEGKVRDVSMDQQQQLHCDGSHGSRNEGLRKRERRVSFMAAGGGGMQSPVAS